MMFISILILIVAIALPSINKQLTPVLFTRISSIVFIYSGALALNALYIQSIGSGIGIYSGLFHITFISQLFDIFLFVIASAILISWPLISNSLPLNGIIGSTNSNGYNIIKQGSNNSILKGGKEEKIIIDRSHYPIEYSLIVLFSTLGASLLISSSDLVSMYLSIELQSFGVYILSTLYRDSESATNAGLKYFLLGALSSCFILLGAGIVYSYTGLTNFETIYSLISVNNSSAGFLAGTEGIILGFILIFTGLLFKISAAPLHNWAPDVYEDTPNIVTIWLTIMPKISILILLLELYTQLNSPSGTDLLIENSIYNLNLDYNILKNLLLISSLLSLIIGTVVGLSQTRIKRLLAYSTISHIGFILLALAINTEQSIESFIFYIFQYTITNLNVFLIILALGYIIQNNWTNKTKSYFAYYKDFETDLRFLSELRGQFFANPLLSLSLTISLFSMAGIPPLMGFFSKQFVLYSAVENGYYFMSVVAIIVSVISASYYLKIVKLLHMDTEGIISNTEVKTTPATHNPSIISYQGAGTDLSLTSLHSFLISYLTLTILLFVLKPSILLNSTQVLSLSLFNF